MLAAKLKLRDSNARTDTFMETKALPSLINACAKPLRYTSTTCKSAESAVRKVAANLRVRRSQIHLVHLLVEHEGLLEGAVVGAAFMAEESLTLSLHGCSVHLLRRSCYRCERLWMRREDVVHHPAERTPRRVAGFVAVLHRMVVQGLELVLVVRRKEGAVLPAEAAGSSAPRRAHLQQQVRAHPQREAWHRLRAVVCRHKVPPIVGAVVQTVTWRRLRVVRADGWYRHVSFFGCGPLLARGPTLRLERVRRPAGPSEVPQHSGTEQ